MADALVYLVFYSWCLSTPEHVIPFSSRENCEYVRAIIDRENGQSVECQTKEEMARFTNANCGYPKTPRREAPAS